MTVSVLLDEMYPPALALQLREAGHDVIAVAAAEDLVGTDDDTVLTAAAEQRRVLVTENVHDFAVLARDRAHQGLLFVNGRRWPRTRAGIPALVAALSSAISTGSLPGANELRWLTH